MGTLAEELMKRYCMSNPTIKKILSAMDTAAERGYLGIFLPEDNVETGLIDLLTSPSFDLYLRRLGRTVDGKSEMGYFITFFTVQDLALIGSTLHFYQID
jgi:hypothetical protein